MACGGVGGVTPKAASRNDAERLILVGRVESTSASLTKLARLENEEPRVTRRAIGGGGGVRCGDVLSGNMLGELGCNIESKNDVDAPSLTRL
jgi:hypothetical protein